MSAAITLADHGAKVAVLDRGQSAGGQIYRAASNSPLPQPEQLGPDYTIGAELISAFERASHTHLKGADAWHIGEDGRILFSQEGQTHELQAREMLLCPGAMERPMPIPGWTLPGVMTAGAAQVMLKSDAIVAEDAIFAGSGPLLYLIVAQYLRLGVAVKAVVDTTPRQNYLQAVPLLPRAMRQSTQLFKGLHLLNEIRRSGVPVYRHAEDLALSGPDRVEGLSFRQGGQHHQLIAETVFLHQGVQPNLNMTRAMGLSHAWNPEQLCWQVKTDAFGQSSVSHVSVAGDGAGIVGAEGAKLAGELAALNILCHLGKLTCDERDQRATSAQRKLRAMAPFRSFIDRLYRPSDAQRLPQDNNTLVCRCEEQDLASLRAGFEQGATDPNALKSLTRCGMGPCQGRQCGHMVAGLLVQWRGEPIETIGYFRLRSPLRLVSIEELSHFQQIGQPPEREAPE